MNEGFVRDFMALSPLYDPNDIQAAKKPTLWEDSAERLKALEKP